MRRTMKIVLPLIVLILGALTAVPAGAAVFNVLLDINPVGGQLEPDAVDSGGFSHYVSGDLATTTLTAPDGSSFTLAIEAINASGEIDGTIDWRDRGDAGTEPLARLAEDFVKNNSGKIRVTLGDVPAGKYLVTSYHLDPLYSQCSHIRVLVDDSLTNGFHATAAVANTRYSGDAPEAAGLTTSIVESHSATFVINSNGQDDIAILFDGSPPSATTETPFNGLRITPVELPFYAEIDFGSTGQRAATGFLAVEGAGDGSAFPSTEMVSQSGDLFTLGISSVDWRDRGNSISSAPLAELVEDLVKNNSGDITVTLGGLPEGSYSATSFHLDPGYEQCSAIEIYVTDALGSDVLQEAYGNAGELVDLDELTTAAIQRSSATFEFESNGVDDIIIRFDGTGSDVEVPLNGLTIRQVPEPATLFLVTLVAGMALLARPRSGRHD